MSRATIVSGAVPMVAARENDPLLTVALAPFTVTVTGGAVVVTVPVTVAEPPAAPGRGRTASSVGAPKSDVRSSSGARSSWRASVSELKLLSRTVVVPAYCAGGAFMRPTAGAAPEGGGVYPGPHPPPPLRELLAL